MYREEYKENFRQIHSVESLGRVRWKSIWASKSRAAYGGKLEDIWFKKVTLVWSGDTKNDKELVVLRQREGQGD